MTSSPIAAHRDLGTLLRKAREDAGIQMIDAAQVVDRSASWLSRVERAIYKPSALFIKALLDFYGQGDALTPTALELARQSKGRPWHAEFKDIIDGKFEIFLDFEGAARRIRTFEQGVPGICQTPEYARAIIEANVQVVTEEGVRRRVDLKMRRQRRLAADNPPHLSCVIDEAALLRRVGGPIVMRAQLQHLAKLAERRNVSVQVLPLARGAHAASDGSFVLLDLASPRPEVQHKEADHIVAYTENALGSVVYDQPESAMTFTQIWEAVCSEALPTDESRALLHRLAEDLP